MPHLHYNKYAAYQNLTRYFEIRPGQNFTGSRTFTLQTCQRKPNMPKKTKLYSRFLLLRIYPDSSVHTSASARSEFFFLGGWWHDSYRKRGNFGRVGDKSFKMYKKAGVGREGDI